MQEDNQIGDYSVLVVECLAIREAIMVAIKKNFQGIITKSDSQLILNAIHHRIFVSRDIVNLAEDIRHT